MLELTVKTLDGKNRSFCVPEEITVKQFKEKIAGSIEISADTQRLIFHGRVLQNEKKLNQYDVNGKTIHVVQSKPPARTEASSTAGGASSSTSAAPGGGSAGPGGRAGPGGSSFVLGSFSLPSEVVDPNQVQNIVQQALTGMGDVGRNARVSTRTSGDGGSVDVHINLGQISMPPLQSESQQRITQARRMLQAARTSLDKLENPSRPSPEQRDNSMDTSSPGSQRDVEMDQAAARPTDAEGQESRSEAESQGSRSEAEGQGPRSETDGQGSRSDESQDNSDAASTTSSEDQRGTRRPRQPNIGVLAELFQEVFELNRRLQPHLERYHTLLESDPAFDAESQTEERSDAQRLFNHVSEILHYVSHAYHSVSDIMVDMQRPPPRSLSAAVAVAVGHPLPQATQFNIADIHRAPTGSPASSTASGATAGSGTTTTSSGQAGTRASSGTQTQTTGIPIGIPLGGNAPFQDVTVDIGPNSVTINSVSAHVVGGITTGSGTGSSQTTPTTAAQTSGGSTGTTQSQPAGGANTMPAGLHGILPPDVLQNIIQMATAAGARPHGPQPVLVISQGMATPTQMPPLHMQAPRMSARPSGATPQGPRTTQAPPPPGVSIAGTRPRGGAAFVIPRPGMIPGMHMGAPPVDPFLPCQSRHFLARRAAQSASQAPPTSSPEQALSGMVSNLVTSLVNQSASPFMAGGIRPPGSTPATTATGAPLPNMFAGLFGTPPGGVGGPATVPPGGSAGAPPAGEPLFVAQLRNILQQQQAPPGAPPTSSTSSSTTSSSQSAPAPAPAPSATPAPGGANEMFSQLVGGIGSYVSQAMMGQQPSGTVGDFLDQLGQSYGVPVGDSGFFTEVFNCVSRHLTFVDLMSVFFGQPGPLQRVRQPLQDFVKERVLEGREATPENIDHAVEKLLEEMEPDIDATMTDTTPKEDVDFKATLTEFMRQKLKGLIKLILDSSEADANFGSNLRDLVRDTMHQAVVLCRMCLEGGDQAVETLLQNRVRSISHEINPMMQQWMVDMSAQQFHRILPTITVTESQVMCYIVRRHAAAAAARAKATATAMATAATPMDAASPQSSDGSSYMSAESADAAREVAGCSEGANHNESMELGDSEEEEQEHVDHVKLKRPNLSATLLEKVPLPPKHDNAVNGSVPIGSEDWHQVVPESWVPVITRDAQRQLRQGYQPPLSDAYNSGMPAKRRKMMTASQDLKLADVNAVLPETIRRTVRSTNATPSTSVDDVAAAASASATLQAAFRQEMTSVIRQRAENDPDCIRGKFPSTEKLLKKD